MSRLDTRLGTHQSFFQAMVARLSAGDYARLAKLRSRSLDDASIALLDAWAVVADVLAFYQERIANECYLRTATERRSLVETGRLVGYRPRPGVSAATHLAFSLENEAIPGEIPKGTRVNSVPGPGEKMVAFETSETIVARREWNAIRPRLVRPHPGPGLYLKGTKTGLKPDDPLLTRTGKEAPRLHFIHSLVEDHENDRTFVRFDAPAAEPAVSATASTAGPGGLPDERSIHGIASGPLLRPGTLAPANAAALPRTVATSFRSSSDTLPRLLGTMQPALEHILYEAMRNVPPAPLPLRVFALRVEARPFGHNAPLELVAIGAGGLPDLKEWELGLEDGGAPSEIAILRGRKAPGHGPRRLYLDNDYVIAPDSFVAIVREDGEQILLGDPKPGIKENLSFKRLSLHAYGMSGKSVLIQWDEGHTDESKKTPVWLNTSDIFPVVRSTRVFASSEELVLADGPIEEPVEGSAIELDGLYDGLEAGRWLVIEGERSDIVGTAGPVPGVRAAELVMLAAVEQTAQPPATASTGVHSVSTAEPAPPGEKLHTILTLAGDAGTASGLAYSYRRDSVRIYANVAPATHGETRAEVLGSGDAAVPIQTFALKQPPLTHVSAATPTGIASTLEVRVNDLLWHEAASLAGLGPNDRKYVTRDDDSGVTSVIFGNGVRGARLPTGRENVRGLYRSGIGRMGNVPAGRLSLLATRPLGVKGVVNPVPATGGADRESAASIRRNAPIALMALDRLVSTSDYADFSRNFGGVGKARSTRNRERDAVNIVVAGVDDIPIGEGSELIRNLGEALRRFGDRQVAVEVEPRKRLLLVIQAAVRIDADYEWASVEPKIRAALLDEFGFDRIDLGEWLPLGRALKALQAVPGVVYADVDTFDRLTEADIFEGFTRELGAQLERKELIEVALNEIAYLAPDAPDTLILQELSK